MWLALRPVVTLAWLVAVSFILLHVAVGFTAKALVGVQPSRTENADGTEPPVWGFDEAQVSACG